MAVSIVLGAFLWMSFSLGYVHAGVASPRIQASSLGKKPLAPSVATVIKKKPLLEMHVSPNGLTLLRGVQVESITGNSLVVKAAWEASEFTWEVEINPFTKFLNAQGEKESVAELHPGDTVTLTGVLGLGGVHPRLTADVVRMY